MKILAKESYRSQIVRIVRAMSQANHEACVARDLTPESRPSRVKMFVDGNLEKRMDKLQTQLDFVADAFDDFDDLIVEYIRCNTSEAFDSAATDGERLLVWLGETKDPTPEQRDYMTCQRARHGIEQLARKNRLRHVRFHERYSLTERWLGELESNHELNVYLNPIRTWSRFDTNVLLEDDAVAPANVMFFAAGAEIGTAFLELEGQALLNELADYEPFTLDEWSALTIQADRDELLDMCRDLAEMGLVAFG